MDRVSQQSSTGHAFRPDIEGLRGVSVAAVVLFHAFPDQAPGGFTGVDVFFVISGFLITQLLVAEFQSSGTIDVAAFWARRVRRILPAATIVLLAVCALACTIPAFDSRQLGRQIVAAALFSLNWKLAAQGADYLAASEDPNPALHYWSLAVEEQFYAAWPLIALGALWLSRGARRLQSLAVVIVVASAASMAMSFYLATADPPLAFFSTTTRAWQLLVGAGAMLMTRWRIVFGSSALDVGAVAAIASLLACFLAIRDHTHYPSVVALAPTLAAAMLLCAGGAQNALRPAGRSVSSYLSSAPLRYLGRISFSLYLWHWPLLVFGALLFGDSNAIKWLALAASVALAAATYRYVEQPARRSVWLSASNVRTFCFGAALIVLSVAAGLALRQFGTDDVALGGGRFLSREAIKRDRPPIYDDGCLLRFQHVSYERCAYGDATGRRTVVLFGDSHAGNWFAPLTEAASRLGWTVLVRAKASCRPVDAPQFHVDGRPYPECAAWRARVLAEIATLRPNLVIVASLAHGLEPDGERRVMAALAQSAGAVVAMRNTPALSESVVACLKRTKNQDACVWPLSGLLQKPDFPSPATEAAVPTVAVHDLNSRICPDGLCRAVVNQRPMMTDQHHLANSFSATLVDAFADLLKSHAPTAE